METLNSNSIKDFFIKVLNDQNVAITTKLVETKVDEYDLAVQVNDQTLIIEFKNEVFPKDVTSLTKQSAQSKHPLLVIANYITPKAKEQLIESQINYLDRAENIYLKLSNLLLKIEGNKNSSVKEKYKSRAFSKTGAAVVFQFLLDPRAVNHPQRTIAKMANVSLGTIPKVFEGLLKDKFIIKDTDTSYRLINYKALLEKWIPVFNEKVLPNYKIGTYTFSRYNNTNWKDQLAYPQVFWGGEPGAALLTKYLNPEKFTLFTTKTKQQILTELKLVPDTNGEITIYQSFWDTYTLQTAIDLIAEKNTAPPVLIYAQLLYSGNERNIETAQIIFDDHIKNKF